MIHELIMAAGSWELQLHDDTPREVLDEIVPYALLCVAPNPLEIDGSADGDLLSMLRWAGAVRRPGPQTSIGGSGLAIFMGDEDGKVIAGGGANLPDSEIAASSTDVFFWVQDCISDTGLTVGSTKVQNLGGGPFMWEHTQRAVLDWVADSTATEWRVNPDLTVDCNTYTVLYGSTPTVTLTRRGQGRENDVASFDGLFEVNIDAEDYVSKVTVLGAGGIGTIGGASPYFAPGGGIPLHIWKVVQDQGVAAGTELGTAASILGRYNTLRQEVRLSTDAYDVRGELECGGLVAVCDPDRGLSAPLGSANPVPFRGDWILPLTLRCTSIDWPVRNGMGVYVRRWDGAAYRWTDLAPYVVWEEQPAVITLGANRRWAQGGHSVPLGGRYG